MIENNYTFIKKVHIKGMLELWDPGPWTWGTRKLPKTWDLISKTQNLEPQYDQGKPGSHDSKIFKWEPGPGNLEV